MDEMLLGRCAVIRLSIIVPALGDQSAIDATLVSILENRPNDCEIILACPRSYVDPYDLHDEIRFVRCPESARPEFLLNRALSASAGECIHWLQPGVQATKNWTDSSTEIIASGASDFTSPLVLSHPRANRIAYAGVRYGRFGSRKLVGKNLRLPIRRKRLKVNSPSMSAGFCHRDSLLDLGGFHSTFGPHLTDADLAARIEAAGMKCTVTPSSIVIAEAEYATAPLLGFERGRKLEHLYWHHAQARVGTTFPGHFAVVVFDTITQLPRLACITSLFGRLVGSIDVLRRHDDDHGLTQEDTGSATATNHNLKRAA